MSVPRIAIVGLGGLFPGASTPEQLWANVLAGLDAASDPPSGRWWLSPEFVHEPGVISADRVPSRHACFLAPFAPDLAGLDIDPALVTQLDVVFQLALTAAAQAWRSARMDAVDRQRVGVILGSIALPTEKVSALARHYLGRALYEKVGRPCPFLDDGLPHPLNRHVTGLPAGLVAKALRLGGTSFTLDAACASSLYAIKLAMDELQSGRAGAMLAGGLSRPDSLYTQMGFAQLRALSPTGRCSPFDARADGLVVGEGAGVFVLKRLDDAIRDGDRVLGVIAGVGLSNDISGGLLAPANEGQLRALRAAYACAGWRPDEVDLIECHATGTPVGDQVEFQSLRTLWENCEQTPGRCVIGSVKSTVGHLLTGAGAAALTKVLFALNERVLPPTANFVSPAPALHMERSPFRVLRQAEAWPLRSDRPRRAAISAFGFGGVNAHLLVEEAPVGDVPGRFCETLLKTRQESPVAVVALRANLAPGLGIDDLRRRLLGHALPEPRPSRRWWGVSPTVAGHYFDAVTVQLGRYRIPPREIEEMLPQQALLLETAGAALTDAGLSGEQPRTGAFIGISLDLNTTNFHLRWAVLRDDPSLVDVASPPLSANRTMGALASIAASRVAREFGLGGPSFTLSSMETSGLHALAVAVEALRRGELDHAIVGAVDLAGDVRDVLTRQANTLVGEGAVVVVLKRLDDAIRDGNTIHAVIRDIGVASGEDADAIQTGCIQTDVGQCGAADGLVSFLWTCLCLQEQVLPAGPQTRLPLPWLRDRADGPRRASVHAVGQAGCVRVVLEEGPIVRTTSTRPTPSSETLFVVEGSDISALLAELDRLRLFAGQTVGVGLEASASRWWRQTGRSHTGNSGRAVALIARDGGELSRLIDQASDHLRLRPGQPLGGRVFWSPEPLGRTSRIALVYPGSGNDFAGMGRDIALRWPELLRRQHEENQYLARQYLPEAVWGEPARPLSVKERIFAQVALGSLVTDLLVSLGGHPDAAIGYSLGESSALFSLRAWRDRDGMLQAMNASTLFVSDLTGRCDAARAAWGLEASQSVDWLTGIVERSPDEVRAALTELDRAYLQIINTPRECVIGGHRPQVEELVRRLSATLVPVPETTTMHCAVVKPVAGAYRALHRWPTTPSDGVRFYSAGWGRAYDVDPDSVADAILAQAIETIDFPRVIESAYRDGVRLFIEAGPGASCSRMIAAILGDRPHVARSACVSGGDGLATVWRLLAHLIAERVPIDLARVYAPEPERPSQGRAITIPVGGEPFVVPQHQRRNSSPPAPLPDVGQAASLSPVPGKQGCLPYEAEEFFSLRQIVGVVEARSQAHAAYLRLSDTLRDTFAQTLAFQGRLFEQMLASGVASGEPGCVSTGSTAPLAGGASLPALTGPGSPLAALTGPGSPLPVLTQPGSPALDRSQCLEFAIGSIGKVLGPAFAEIDSFPTRVRLPDEPLMLVDRILSIDAEPLSLTQGRVVTEHDILPNAWYLDAGRIPTCIAIEAGQADLFLSGYLGIDLRTRGLAVYRLLDAVVTFHRGLPQPGETIRYDIHIDHFFRQGQTYLFRFRFEGSVNGQPLLTMTDGCAGFFTSSELAAGKGVIHTELQRRPRPGVEPDDADIRPSVGVERYDESQVDALRQGDLAGCFGPLFANLPLRQPMRLPGGRMRLVHRVTQLDPRGGRFGIGLIRAEADIHPDDWFLTCHFVDDQVMPGTLMYECCLHTLRIFLMRLGWVGEHDRVVCEPVPGVASRLKCRGQVTAAVHTVTYEVVVKERGYRPEPYALADAHMYADGKLIVDINDMCVQLTGLSREQIAGLWQGTASRPALFDRQHILAFAVGKPSEAFGEPYRIFDEGRFIARFPGPPYSFLDRIVAIDAQPWQMVRGGVIEAEYDVPPDEWYFASERAAVMPFCVLQEVVLQACGFLAAFMGSALTSPGDLHFRNLGGDAHLLRAVTPETGTLTTRVRCDRVSSSAGMIIQGYEFDLRDRTGCVYHGTTTFGFFSPQALAQQAGIRDAQPYRPTEEEQRRARTFDYPREAPYPDTMLGMLDQVSCFVPDGGPARLGFIEGVKQVRPEDWFFAAHFYQDPVMPGSLGLEALLQLVKVVAAERWRPGERARFEANLGEHRWLYRGQVIPTSRQVVVQAVVTACDDTARQMTADGYLSVDGLVIYRMNGFTLRLIETSLEDTSSNLITLARG